MCGYRMYFINPRLEIRGYTDREGDRDGAGARGIFTCEMHKSLWSSYLTTHLIRYNIHFSITYGFPWRDLVLRDMNS